jgi:hypothetical protein
MVPTLQCGLLRSNFSFAILLPLKSALGCPFSTPAVSS